MPLMTTVEISEVVRGRATSAATSELITYCETQLKNMLESGKATQVILDQEERPATIQRAFNRALVNLVPDGSKRCDFITAPNGKRRYEKNDGNSSTEVYKFFVKISEKGSPLPAA